LERQSNLRSLNWNDEATEIADEQQLLRLQFGDSVAEFDATIAVSQAGYVREISYDFTTETSNGPRQ